MTARSMLDIGWESEFDWQNYFLFPVSPSLILFCCQIIYAETLIQDRTQGSTSDIELLQWLLGTLPNR